MNNLQAVVLAAGKSTRFNTNRSKLVEKICGQEMILYPVRLLENLKIKTTLVVGYQKDEIINLVKKKDPYVNFIEQTEQLGTGHAVAITKDSWQAEHILIINGDAPLLTEEAIKKLYEKHLETDSAISFVVAHNIDPSLKSYGRVIEEGNKLKIVEAKDDEIKDRRDCCINAGVYLVKTSFLKSAINEVKKSSVTGEFYITKLIEMANEKDLCVSTITESFDTIRGINTLKELWVAEQIKRSELIQYWMTEGVRFSAAQNIHMDLSVKIGKGSYVGPGVKLSGDTVIGENTYLEGLTVIENCKVGNAVKVSPNCVIKNSEVQDNCNIGPFCYIYNNSVVEKNCSIEGFTEINESSFSKIYSSFSTSHAEKKSEKFIAAKAAKLDGSELQV